MHMEIRKKKPYRKQFLFLPCGFQEADSSRQAGRQTHLSAEPSCCPPFFLCIQSFYSGDDTHIQDEFFLLGKIETLSLAHLEVCLLGDSKSQGKLSITPGLIQKYR